MLGLRSTSRATWAEQKPRTGIAGGAGGRGVLGGQSWHCRGAGQNGEASAEFLGHEPQVLCWTVDGCAIP